MDEEIVGTLEKLEREFDKIYFQGSIDPHLASGHPGIALFYGYYYRLTKDRVHLQKCENIIERLIDYVSEYEMQSSLYTGLSGICWVIQHLIDEKILEADEAILDTSDEFIARSGVSQINLGNYDFMHGGVGCGFYLLGRQSKKKYLPQLLEALDRLSQKNEYGQFWVDDFSNYPIIDRCINFGVAHGLPGIISFLSKTLEEGIEVELTKSMLTDTLSFFLTKSELQTYVGSYFPRYRLFEGERAKDMSRLGWCYGDLSASIALVEAANAMGNPVLETQAMDILLKTLTRKSYGETLIKDGSLCHGYGGVAHIYNRLYLKTGKDEFKIASRFWQGELFEYIRMHGGIESFPRYDGVIDKYVPSTNFLVGSAGIGLALISIINPEIDPRWDQLLLLS